MPCVTLGVVRRKYSELDKEGESLPQSTSSCCPCLAAEWTGIATSFRPGPATTTVEPATTTHSYKQWVGGRTDCSEWYASLSAILQVDQCSARERVFDAAMRERVKVLAANNILATVMATKESYYLHGRSELTATIPVPGADLVSETDDTSE